MAGGSEEAGPARERWAERCREQAARSEGFGVRPRAARCLHSPPLTLLCLRFPPYQLQIIIICNPQGPL